MFFMLKEKMLMFQNIIPVVKGAKSVPKLDFLLFSQDWFISFLLEVA